MQRELEKYIIGCDSLEMQHFIREMNEKDLIILYNRSGVYARRKFEDNITKRMLTFLKQERHMQVRAEEEQEAEEKALEYFRSEDFTEYHNIKVKAALSVMKVMRKKRFPEKYIKTFWRTKYEDETIVANVDSSWHEIFLFEEKYGFPRDSIIPYLENHKVKLCVLLEEQEHIIGELACYLAFCNMLPEAELIRFAVLVKNEAICKAELERLPKKRELKDWQIAFKKVYDSLKESEAAENWSVMYRKMDKLAKEMIAREMIPEGAFINLWIPGGSYLQFTFYEKYTLADVVNPYRYERYSVVAEEDAITGNLRCLEGWAFGVKNAKELLSRVKEAKYKDMYFGTINGV